MTQTKPTISGSLVGDEHALAFCFDVLSSAGSMDFASLSNLLRPWDWNRNALLDRFHELQRSGLVHIEHPNGGSRDTAIRAIRVYITPEGRLLSEGTGLPFRRPIPVLSGGPFSGATENHVSMHSTQPGHPR